MQPFANLGKRWRSGMVIDRFSPTPSTLKKQLEREYSKDEEKRDPKLLEAIFEGLAKFWRGR